MRASAVKCGTDTFTLCWYGHACRTRRNAGQKCVGFARRKNYALLKVYETPKVLLLMCTLRVYPVIVFGASWTCLAAQNLCVRVCLQASCPDVLCTHEKNLLLSPAEASIGCFPFAFHTLWAEGTWICSFIWSYIQTHWDARPLPPWGPIPSVCCSFLFTCEIW